MKKVLSFVLALMLACVSFAAVAEGAAFDKTKVTGSSLYNYDRFTKEWSIQGVYTKEYSNARVQVALLLFDSFVEDGMGPELRVLFFDKDTQQYDEVTAFRAVVGEKIYCFEELFPGSNSGSVIGGTVLKELCTALIAGGEVAFQIDHTDKYGSSWTGTIDPVDRTALAELIEMTRLLRDSNAWSLDATPEFWDTFFGATME